MSSQTRSTTDQPQRDRTSRRRFLALSGVGVGWVLGAPPSLGKDGEDNVATERILKRGYRIGIGGNEKEIIEKAYQLGYDYEKQRGG